jgi:FMN phosphatase YigB (HAD superfamily)
MLQTLIFDLGRTLVDFDYAGWGAAFESHREAILRLARQCECGQLGADEFRLSMGKILPEHAENFDPWWCSIFAPKPLVEASWLRELGRRFRLGLLSNTDPIHFQYLRHTYSELLAPFDFMVTSFAAGAAKPGPEIYALAEAHAQCRPEQILYFDDIEAFVGAARARHWQAELFQGQAAAAAAIERHAAADLTAHRPVRN